MEESQPSPTQERDRAITEFTERRFADVYEHINKIAYDLVLDEFGDWNPVMGEKFLNECWWNWQRAN